MKLVSEAIAARTIDRQVTQMLGNMAAPRRIHKPSPIQSDKIEAQNSHLADS